LFISGDYAKTSRTLNESLSQSLAAAIATLRRLFQNVIRHARIGAVNAISVANERDGQESLRLDSTEEWRPE